jgi:hypothetical protein
MSDEARLLKGIQDDDMKYVISKAFDAGWKSKAVTNGTGQAVIIWPATRGTVQVTKTPSDWRTVKQTASEIRRVSHVRVYPPHKHARVQHDDEDRVTLVNAVQDNEVDLRDQVDRLAAEFKHLMTEFIVLSRGGGEPTNDEVEECKDIMRRVLQIEETFKMLHQPVPEYALHTPTQRQPRE